MVLLKSMTRTQIYPVQLAGSNLKAVYRFKPLLFIMDSIEASWLIIQGGYTSPQYNMLTASL